MMNPSAQLADRTNETASSIPGLESPVELIKETISRYFEALSAEDFQTTAGLFAEAGVLHPPFESPIVGRGAIVSYLEAEAKGLQLLPLNYATEFLEDGTVQCDVIGKVQTPLFGVNVSWRFLLNSTAEILLVRVRLLAALEELLKLKSKS